MKPIIGITTYYIGCEELSAHRACGLNRQDMIMLTVDYSSSVIEAGGLPIYIPISSLNEEDIELYLNKIDGLIFSGGHDIHPKYYDEKIKYDNVKPNIKRDKFEMKLLSKAIERKKPILGICRGLQLINIYFGGKLFQDIKEDKNTNIDHRGSVKEKTKQAHEVNLKDGLLLNRIYNESKLLVNSVHHQAISKLGDGLVANAKSNDSIIEGIEHKDYPFIIGVQWHPEMLFESYNEHIKIFKYLINLSN